MWFYFATPHLFSRYNSLFHFQVVVFHRWIFNINSKTSSVLLRLSPSLSITAPVLVYYCSNSFHQQDVTAKSASTLPNRIPPLWLDNMHHTPTSTEQMGCTSTDSTHYTPRFVLPALFLLFSPSNISCFYYMTKVKSPCLCCIFLEKRSALGAIDQLGITLMKSKRWLLKGKEG